MVELIQAAKDALDCMTSEQSKKFVTATALRLHDALEQVEVKTEHLQLELIKARGLLSGALEYMDHLDGCGWPYDPCGCDLATTVQTIEECLGT